MKPESFNKALAHLNKQKQIKHSYQGVRNTRYLAREEINPQIAEAIHIKTDWPEYRSIPLVTSNKKKAKTKSVYASATVKPLKLYERPSKPPSRHSDRSERASAVLPVSVSQKKAHGSFSKAPKQINMSG